MHKDRNCTQGTFSFQLAFSHKFFTYNYELFFLIAHFADFKYHCPFAQCFSFIPAQPHLA